MIQPWSHVFNKTQDDPLKHLGKSLIHKGKVAIILLAGGQGTRLGYEEPKGTFDLGGGSLFEIQARRIKKICKECDVSSVPWLIMTSKQTHAKTIEFFTRHQFFGLDSVIFFQQGELPCAFDDGTPIWQSENVPVTSPNGNGGIFKALADANLLNQLSEMGVEYVYVYGVDNVAVEIADVEFLALMEQEAADFALKVVERKDSHEQVGVLAIKNNQPAIIEYSELQENLVANALDDEGKLKFRLGNICQHIFRLSLLKRLVSCELPLHLAHKKIPFFQDGVMVTPSAPNGFKSEFFIFDCLQFLSVQDVLVFCVDRSEFVPLKSQEDIQRCRLCFLHKDK